MVSCAFFRALSTSLLFDITAEMATDRASWYCGKAGVIGMVVLAPTESAKTLKTCRSWSLRVVSAASASLTDFRGVGAIWVRLICSVMSLLVANCTHFQAASWFLEPAETPKPHEKVVATWSGLPGACAMSTLPTTLDCDASWVSDHR